MPHDPYEFYETPPAFTRYLFRAMTTQAIAISGRLLESCVGAGAIVHASADVTSTWLTNDLDPAWPAHLHHDAGTDALRLALGDAPVDWVISNPPFTPALAIIEEALQIARVGVAMHLRASIHEVLKTGPRRTWMATHLPSGILWLPRYAYQRSPTTGKWTQDTVCACWVIWLRDPWSRPGQFIHYAPEWVIDELRQGTAAYRTRMDHLMAQRHAQRKQQR